MRILLFQPRGYPHSGALNIHSLACVLPPLGLASIAAYVRKGGHEVALLDASIAPHVPNDQWAQRITQWNPDIVGLTATTSSFGDAYDVCANVKNLRSSIRTVFGGVHVSWGQERLLTKFPAIDYIIAGEGEGPLLKLADGIALQEIEGLLYRDGPHVLSGPLQSTLSDLDQLPYPAFDLLEGFPKKYLLPLFSYPRHPGVNLVSSRGCVYQCSYCDRSVFGRSFRANSAEYMHDEILWLRKDFGIRHVNFYDDLFTTNRNRISRFCELMMRTKRPPVSFNCIVRIGHIDDELIRMLKRAGCWMVNVGIESGDQAILDTHKDGLTLEAIRRDVQKIHNAGIWVKGLFMVGFPGETEASIKKTLDFALSLPLKDANVTAFTPFPGAPITDTISSYGTLDEDWSTMDCEHVVFVPHSLGSREKLEQLRAEFIRRFYQRPWMRKVYRRMLHESPHSYWRLLRNLPTYLRFAASMKDEHR